MALRAKYTFKEWLEMNNISDRTILEALDFEDAQILAGILGRASGKTTKIIKARNYYKQYLADVSFVEVEDNDS